MHKLTSSFVLAYHGCDQSVADRLLGGADFKASQNDYDWLGHGIYFWEANPQRGLEFAHELQNLKRSAVKTPAVVGAVVELGLCLDATTSAGIQQVRTAHEQLVRLTKASDQPLPKNSPDHLMRNLDCAVIRVLHQIREYDGEQPIDTLKGVFVEGCPVFENSGFREKTHIQICVREPECIKGIFRVSKRFLE